MKRRRSVLAAAVAVALSAIVAAVAGAPAAGSQPLATYLDRSTPGVYVTELDAFGQSIVPTQTGVPLMVGQGAATAAARVSRGSVLIPSQAAFAQYVQEPSPRLAAAVAAFFNAGGSSMWVTLTADESAASLSAALRSTPLSTGEFDLITVPELAELSGSDYLSVATAADQLASTSDALALLDPPDVVMSQVSAGAGNPAPLITLANQLRGALPAPGFAALYGTGLVDAQGNAVPVSAMVAGMFAANDQQDGVWQILGGLDRPLTGVSATWSPTNAQLGALEPNGIVAFRTVAGYGPVIWGNDTLARAETADAAGGVWFINERRELNWINASVRLALQNYVFAANVATTWAEVTSSISSFLQTLYSEGAFSGDTASQAFSVSCGLGSTMTSQDILNGYLIVQVHVQLQEQPDPITLSFSQAMGSS